MRHVTMIAALALAGACSGDGSGGSAGSGGSGSACSQRLDFSLVCPGDIVVGATGQVTVDNYVAANINQLTFGAAGSGNIDPPAAQVPDPADSSTNIPASPYTFSFTALTAGDAVLSVATFDLSEDDCLVVKTCNFDVVDP